MSEASFAERKIVQPDDQWRIVAGMHAEPNGDLAVVWLGWEKDSEKDAGRIHLYDSWVFRRNESLPFIVDAIKQRGSWIPVSYEKAHEEIATKLGDKGVRVLRGPTNAIEGYDDSETLAAWNSREINDRLNAGTMLVLDTNDEWIKEYDHFIERGGLVPQVGFPLMAATRHAFHALKRSKKKPQPTKIVYEPVPA